jgi:predicted transcriptional regulator
MNSLAPEIVEIFQALSDDASFNIIDIVINSAQTVEELKEKLNISSKRCYDRITKLRGIGLIKRKGLNYSITSFGRIMYEAQLKIAKAAQNISKLKMIDAAANIDLAPDDYRRLIDALIGDNEIKNFIIALPFHKEKRRAVNPKKAGPRPKINNLTLVL